MCIEHVTMLWQLDISYSITSYVQLRCDLLTELVRLRSLSFHFCLTFIFITSYALHSFILLPIQDFLDDRKLKGQFLIEKVKLAWWCEEKVDAAEKSNFFLDLIYI